MKMKRLLGGLMIAAICCVMAPAAGGDLEMLKSRILQLLESEGGAEDAVKSAEKA